MLLSPKTALSIEGNKVLGAGASSLLTGLQDVFLFNAGGVTTTSVIQGYVLTNIGGTSSPTITGPAGGGDLGRVQNGTTGGLTGAAVTFQIISDPAAQWAFEVYISLDPAQEATGAINFYGPRNNTSGIFYNLMDWNPGAAERRYRVFSVDNVPNTVVISPAAGTSPADSVWHHILGWRDAVNVNMQLDGGSVISAASAGTRTGTYNFLYAFSAPVLAVSRYSLWTRAFTADERTFLNSAVKTYPWAS